MKDVFSKIGPCRAEILSGADQKSRGQGTVLFDSASDAARAVQSLNNATLDGRVIVVKIDAKAGGK